MTDLPPTPPQGPDAPAPGWWQASDGNWYPPDQRPGYAAAPPAYGAPPTYGQPYGQAYGYGYAAPAPRSTNGVAIAALVLGCLQFFVWIISGIPAIICGHIALSQIRRTGQEGRGMAMAGLILGYLGLAAFIAFVVVILIAADELDDGSFRIESLVVR